MEAPGEREVPLSVNWAGPSELSPCRNETQTDCAKQQEQRSSQGRCSEVEQAIADLFAWSSDLSWLTLNPAVAVAVCAFVFTAILMAVGVPGVIVPVSITSGVMLDAEIAAAAVAAGGALGSHALFLLTRRSLQDKARRRLGERIAPIERAFARGGAWYVLGLRIIGAPSLVLTGACALLPINQGKFAMATFVGFLPAAWVAASIGSAF